MLKRLCISFPFAHLNRSLFLAVGATSAAYFWCMYFCLIPKVACGSRDSEALMMPFWTCGAPPEGQDTALQEGGERKAKFMAGSAQIRGPWGSQSRGKGCGKVSPLHQFIRMMKTIGMCSHARQGNWMGRKLNRKTPEAKGRLWPRGSCS